MERITHRALTALAFMALLAGAAHAAETTANVSGSADVQLARRIEQRAAAVSAKAQAEAQAKLLEVAKKADAAAAKSGDAQVSTRLAAEFGTTASALMNESADASWGDLVIAHTLAANAAGDVTATQLLDLRQDGMGWGTIAAGLGFSTAQAVNAAKAEANVAAGLARADGRVAAIATTGATASVSAATSVAGTAANAGVQSAVSAAGASVNATTNLGLGLGR